MKLLKGKSNIALFLFTCSTPGGTSRSELAKKTEEGEIRGIGGNKLRGRVTEHLCDYVMWEDFEVFFCRRDKNIKWIFGRAV